MNCSHTDLLRAYLDGELSEKNNRYMEQHVESCLICQQQLLAADGEEHDDMVILAPRKLPADFTRQVMSAITEAPLRKKRPNWKKRSVSIMKKTALAVAGVTAIVTFGSMVSPTFASYVNSVIQSIQGVDNGMKNAAANGYTQLINKQSKDHGITFVVREVVADPMRIAIFCDALDENGKKVSLDDTELDVTYKNRAGKDINPLGGGWTTANEGEYLVVAQDIFEVFKDPQAIPDELIVGVNVTSMGGKVGNWSVEFPVDMKKAKAAVKYTSIEQQYTTPQGISIKLNKMMTVPSASLLEMETNWTQEREAHVQKIMEEHGWKREKPEMGKMTESEIMQRYFNMFGMAYQLLDEQGKAVAGWDDAISNEINGIKANTVDITLRGIGDDESHRGTSWSGFAPLADNQKLRFKLHSLYLFEPAAFKVEVPVDQLLKQKVTKESDGSSFSFTGMSMKTTDTEEKVGEITYRGKGAIVPFTATLPQEIIYTAEWKVTDDSGKAYRVSRGEQYTRGEDGRVHVAGTLFIRDLDKQPKSLTFSYSVKQRQYRDVKWEVPFQMSK